MIAWSVAMLGCAHPVPLDPILPFRFEARPTGGEVRVVPALRLHDTVPPELGSFLGGALAQGQIDVRTTRTHELGELSSAVGRALPGEVNGALGRAWTGQFVTHPFPTASRQRVVDALRTGRDLDTALADAARAIGGDAALISWMDELEARPLTLSDLPGQLLETPAGPVVVDYPDEPYLVTARVGMALVAADGEVVVRYQDTYETVLSGSRGPSIAGRDLAYALAAEVAMIWAVDPRLLEGEPPLRPYTATSEPAPRPSRAAVAARSLR
jgi:hypothetical protein